MVNKEFFDVLSKNINYIKINDDIFSGGTFEIKKYKHKFSSTTDESNKLFYDDEVVKTNGTYINYDCPTCGRNYTILLKKFLLKDSLFCRFCKEQDEEKRKKQSQYVTKSFKDFNKVVSTKVKKDKITNNELIEISNKKFESESDDFKLDYFSKHMTINEYEKIKTHIYSVNGIQNTEKLSYYEHIKNNNQMKYSSYLYDSKNDIFINMNNIKYTCECCDEVFNTTRKPIERVENYKCLCKRCSFSNRTFKIKHTINCINEKILYQSNPELQLIEFCNKMNIIIKNGPKVKYFFNNKIRTYFIDYYIPTKKVIIEIKDNHIWHKNQIDSGQWKMKEETAKKYAKDNGLRYKLIFTQYLQDFLDTF